MSTTIFDWTDCDDSGNDGWLARGYPNFDASSPRNVAHDCVDHFPRGQKHGPVADELLALGARLWIWIDSGAFFNQRTITYSSPPQVWGMEVHRLLEDSDQLSYNTPATIDEPLLDDVLDDEIEYALIEAVRHNENFTTDSPEIQNLAAWLRRGVRAAKERYKGHYAIDVYNLYEEVIIGANRFGTGEPGDRLEVRIHEKRLAVDVRLHSTRNQFE